MVFIEDIKADKEFIPVSGDSKLFENINLVGIFPYETKRVRGSVKVNSLIYGKLLDAVEKKRHLDNKIVIVLEDIRNFGTERYFAIFYHDGGCRIGELEDIGSY